MPQPHRIGAQLRLTRDITVSGYYIGQAGDTVTVFSKPDQGESCYEVTSQGHPRPFLVTPDEIERAQ